LAPRNLEMARSSLIEVLEKCLRREIRNIDVGWPRFVILPGDDRDHDLYFVRDGVKLLRNFGTSTSPLAPFPVFPVGNAYASIEYRVKFQEDKMNRVKDDTGEVVITHFPCCRRNATSAPPALRVNDAYRLTKFDFSDATDKVIISYAVPDQDGTITATRTTKIDNNLPVDNALFAQQSFRLSDFEPKYVTGLFDTLRVAPSASLLILDTYDAKYEAREQLVFQNIADNKLTPVNLELHLQYATLDDANSGRNAVDGYFGFEISHGDKWIGDVFGIPDTGRKMQDLAELLVRRCDGDDLHKK